MAKYNVDLDPYPYNNKSVKFNGKQYGPGARFTTDDACEFLRFQAEVLEKEKIQGWIYGSPNTWEAVEVECRDEQAKAAAAKNAHTPEPTGPPASAGKDGRPAGE